MNNIKYLTLIKNRSQNKKSDMYFSYSFLLLLIYCGFQDRSVVSRNTLDFIVQRFAWLPYHWLTGVTEVGFGNEW